MGYQLETWLLVSLKGISQRFFFISNRIVKYRFILKHKQYDNYEGTYTAISEFLKQTLPCSIHHVFPTHMNL